MSPVAMSVPETVKPVKSVVTESNGRTAVMSPNEVIRKSLGLSSELKSAQKLYNRATQSFLLRDYDATWSQITQALRTLRYYDVSVIDSTLLRKAYILYVSIVGAVLSQRQGGRKIKLSHAKNSLGGYVSRNVDEIVRNLWADCVDAYGGVEGQVDGSVVVALALVLLSLDIHQVQYAKKVIEGWLSTLSEVVLSYLEQERQQDDEILITYERVVELYILHVLPRLDEYDYARTFLDFNSVLTDEKKRIYSQALDKVHQKSIQHKERKTYEKRKEHEQARATVNGEENPASHEEEVRSNLMSSVYSLKSESLLPSDSVSSLKAIESGVAPTPAETTTQRSTSAPILKRPTSDVSPNRTTSFIDIVSTILRHQLDQLRQTSVTARIIVFTVLLTMLSSVAATRSRVKIRAFWKLIWSKIVQTVVMGTKVTFV